MPWQENKTETLTASSDNVTVSDQTFRLNHFLTHLIDSGGTIDFEMIFNNTTTSDYAYRESDDRSADVAHNGSGAGETELKPDDRLGSSNHFSFGFYADIAGEEKLVLSFTVDQVGVGDSSIPSRTEMAGKFALTPILTQTDAQNTGTGSYNTNSTMTTFGSK